MLYKGEVIVELYGFVVVFFLGEWVVLNFIQRLLGIVIMIREVVWCLDDEQIKICDMRKIILGFRMLEKYVVRVGGGYNY